MLRDAIQQIHESSGKCRKLQASEQICESCDGPSDASYQQSSYDNSNSYSSNNNYQASRSDSYYNSNSEDNYGSAQGHQFNAYARKQKIAQASLHSNLNSYNSHQSHGSNHYQSSHYGNSHHGNNHHGSSHSWNSHGSYEYNNNGHYAPQK